MGKKNGIKTKRKVIQDELIEEVTEESVEEVIEEYDPVKLYKVIKDLTERVEYLERKVGYLDNIHPHC